MYGSDETDVLTLKDKIIVLCAFCKYISFDSIFETLYFLKDKKTFLYKLKKILKSEYFEKLLYKEGGEYNRCVYQLSEEGLRCACELIPQEQQPSYLEEWLKRKKKSKGHISHDYYGGTLFNSMILSKEVCDYELERKYDVDRDSKWYIRTDVTIAMGNENCYYGIFFEQDSGIEKPKIICKKVDGYYIAHLISRTSLNVLMISYRSRFSDFIGKVFPYVFNNGCIDRVYTLLLGLKCDLLTLLCYFESNTYEAACELKRVKLVEGINKEKWNHKMEKDRIGLITVAEFCKRCNYQGKKPMETLYMTVICARSIYILMNLPEIEQVFRVVCAETGNNLRLRREGGRVVIDESVLLEYKNVCKDALCYNPFYLYMKNLHNQAGCTKRKNQLLEYLWEPFVDEVKKENILRYHKALLEGTEVMIAPTILMGEYYPVLLPKVMGYLKAVETVINKYFYYAKVQEQQLSPFSKRQDDIKLYLRNCFTYSVIMKQDDGVKNKEYQGEIYVENTYASISALLRVKFFLKEYYGFEIDGRNITIICVVNNFDDAVNTALFLGYWEKEDSISSLQASTRNGKLYIFKKKFNLCFINKSDLINAKETKNPLYLVRRKVMEDGHYAGEGYGYASEKGIYHSSPDGSCAGFYKEVLKALVQE